MATFAGNKGFLGRVNALNRTGVVPNRAYWNNWNGNNFCYYRDGWGCNWYGWGCGAGFFWAQYYADNWWWQDPWTANWCYWNDGCWNWADPVNNTVYIYENGNYVPSENSGDGTADAAPSGTSDNGYAQAPSDNNAPPQEPADNGNTTPPPPADESNNTSAQSPADIARYAEPPPVGDNGVGSDGSQSAQAPLQAGQEGTNPGGMLKFQSPDGSRLVKVTEDGDAFLYDTGNSSSPAKPVYLDSNVIGVNFKDSGTGTLRIELIHKDGSLAQFNRNGFPRVGKDA